MNHPKREEAEEMEELLGLSTAIKKEGMKALKRRKREIPSNYLLVHLCLYWCLFHPPLYQIMSLPVFNHSLPCERAHKLAIPSYHH
jgi:hypothetical protein